jgi:hypothetical protein
MRGMEGAGRLLVVLGLVLVALGLWLSLGPSLPGLGALGRLPGDLRIERPGFRLYVPITTSLLVSLALSALLQALSRLR